MFMFELLITEGLRERTEHLDILLFSRPSLGGVLFPIYYLLYLFTQQDPSLMMMTAVVSTAQSILRCWERQSDDTECKKTLRQPGLHLGLR